MRAFVICLAAGLCFAGCASSGDTDTTTQGLHSDGCGVSYSACKEKCDKESDPASKAACRSGCMRTKKHCSEG